MAGELIVLIGWSCVLVICPYLSGGDQGDVVAQLFCVVDAWEACTSSLDCIHSSLLLSQLSGVHSPVELKENSKVGQKQWSSRITPCSTFPFLLSVFVLEEQVGLP